MFLHREFVPGLAIYSYMVGDEASGHCAVIDPTRDVEPYLRLAREQGLHITEILETHVHADFVSGAVELKARLPYEALYRSTVLRHRSAPTLPWRADRSGRLGPGRAVCSRAAR